MVRTAVPRSARGASQSRNCSKVAVVMELTPVHWSSQMPWKTSVTHPPPWDSAVVTAASRSAGVVLDVAPVAVGPGTGGPRTLGRGDRGEGAREQPRGPGYGVAS